MNKDAEFIQAKLVKRNTSTNYCYLSIKDLENAQQEKRIFTNTIYNAQDWATALAEALNDTQIFLVERNIARILYGGMIRECDRNSCLDFLRLRPNLSSLGDRQNLLRKLI
jgi:Lhr-like helicase